VIERESSANAIDRAGGASILGSHPGLALEGTYAKSAGEVFSLTPPPVNDELNVFEGFVTSCDGVDWGMALIASWALGGWD
jgi:hypothetical protein